MNTTGLKALLKTKHNNIWSDFIPERKPLPAIAYSHITSGGSRLLKGTRTGLFDTWRILVVAKTSLECQNIITALKTLDNTNDDNFKNIFVVADGKITTDPSDKTRTFFIDIKTYDI